jgi:hypothetical protein
MQPLVLPKNGAFFAVLHKLRLNSGSILWPRIQTGPFKHAPVIDLPGGISEIRIE